MKFLILAILTLFLIPWTRRSGSKLRAVDKKGDEKVVKGKKSSILVIPVLFWIGIAIYEYFWLIDDRADSILTHYSVAVAILIGLVLFSQDQIGKLEGTLKGLLMLVLLASYGYFGYLHDIVISQKKYDSVVKVEKDISEPFTENDQPFTVPPKTAENKMKKVFGDIPKVAYFELGELTPQMVNGEALYVAPIEVSGFFKARKAETIPGYVTMSGTNPDAEAKLHLGYKMKYVPSMFFGNNLERVVRQAEPNLIFKGKPKFEVDDKGKPYYTMTYGEFISGRSGFEVEGVVVVDAQTGEVKRYDKGKAPKFVDGVLNHETASTLNTYFGKYIHGFWNTKFSQTDMKIPTEWGTKEGVTPIFGKDGTLYYFTDFTSPKEGVDSALGYSLIDARTGKLYYYNGKEVKGIMDGSAASEVVDNSFKREKWHGTMPVIYNVYGKPSWIVPVIDDGGLVRAHTVIYASNAKIFATGSTQKEALENYKNALSGSGDSFRPTSNGKEAQKEGVVQRVYKEKSGENTIVYVLLENEQKVFMIPVKKFPYAMFTEVGDPIQITYLDTGEAMSSVSKFTNSNLNK
ncbi:hypothetical protein CN268_18515 [Bacillus anthracis]|uniref:DUF3981 domain-containing protein n=1 Tax=Bacillus tropicus TaxID=2026188 RepID=UPI000BF579EB|nr:DUF3981 domain-containing protein [Bacillus tropicus]PES25139.1 hypothetical protein CN488_04045 [Bacillus anthracis]PEY28724.1 hypothetical protein CN340_04575 [Bacillus anthracis]PFB59684.1 hypothetical protein CN268_18515 [Bacillus anthracis]PGR16770.1 hypothetical protein COC50_27735 [Bacillus anthracis]